MSDQIQQPTDQTQPDVQSTPTTINAVSLKNNIVKNKKILLVGALVILVAGILTIPKLVGIQQKQINQQAIKTNHVLVSQKLHPTPTPTSIPLVPGNIQWLKTPQEIKDPQAPLSLLNSMLYSPNLYGISISQGSSGTPMQTPSPVKPVVSYYNVGKWTSGQYSGKSIIDVSITQTYIGQVEYSSTNATISTTSIVRVTPDGNKLIYFPNSSNINLTNQNGKAIGNLIEGIQTPSITVVQSNMLNIDDRALPDLLISYPPYPNGYNSYRTTRLISYKGHEETFVVIPLYTNTWNLNALYGYKLLTTFLKGQKLYAKIQQDTIPWSSIEQSPYLIEDHDHSIIDTYESYNTDEVISHDTGVFHWTQTPINPLGLFPLVDGKIHYSYGPLYYPFTHACSPEPTSQLAGSTGFTPSQLKMVGSDAGNTLYIPTQTDTLFTSLYNNLTSAIPTNAPATESNLTYVQFINTFPVLVAKDYFGEYQILYRYYYLFINGGC